MARLKPVPIHIPKNGGASLWRILGYSDAIGHGRLNDLPDLVVEDVHIFGFLRCPLDRAVSMYYFLKQSPDINFKRGKDRRGLLATHYMLEFVTDVNQFWRTVNPGLLGPVVVMRRQQHWVKGVYAEHFHGYDFARYDSEIERLCKTIGREPRKVTRKVHATKRKTFKEELDNKSIERIKKIYADDFRLLDKYGVPHNG